MSERKYTPGCIGGRPIDIYTPESVWSPYSAFHIAEVMFPVVASRLAETPRPLGVEIGSGSGALAIMFKIACQNARMVTTDLNPVATETTMWNWQQNGLDPDHLTTMVADGIDDGVEVLAKAQGGFDVIMANLPQQPLVNGNELELLRATQAAAWNVDPSRDPDGLGIFESVVRKSPYVMRTGGTGFFSVSSKQNPVRWRKILDGMTSARSIRGWEVLSEQYFDVPSSYDSKLITHWLAREKEDGVSRLIPGPNGRYQYQHYNLAVYY